MFRKIIVITVLSIGLLGCANHQSEMAPELKPAVNVASFPQTHQAQQLPAVQAKPINLQSFPAMESSHRRLTGVAAIHAANRKATMQPNSNEYIDSIMTFDYSPGYLYQVYCAPLRVTDLQFQKGEQVVSVAAGDTLRWEVSRTYSGSGSDRVEHILLKPTDENLTNSLVITTNQRTYHLMLHATNTTYMAAVEWRYPDSDNFVQQYKQEKQQLSDIGTNLDLNQLDFHYHFDLIQGDIPNWKPLMVFNDGRKTFIQFPANAQTAPTLFVGDKHELGVVNYHVEGNFYVVDSVVTHAQLRAGQDDQTILNIVHD
ncbi:MAG: P-type conjugative transfer protein TrbG [Pseudomonadota bacterium]|nr:P-type conjugative transfer protein TrbG [Gammaproteobacteria bacterium]MBU1558714.1 P-type conjugative transfer protein TrbG [Gammaproteobacteria bacterium]MBU1628916.1 P-type conjugative transfer protein TrbG [Gammaproteobacteria bacterium]MBU1926913.1 P-type conjugative transfer protein TrbG [Gammaproteobacteria bacterium]MBU2545741.1 P-type conjugative transfer protein TrbG [Gammaproteobacteria bacterium]